MSSKKKTNTAELDSPQPNATESGVATSETSTNDAQDVAQEQTDSDQGTVETTPKQSSSFSTFVAIIALLIAIAAAGGAGWLWQQLQHSKQTLHQTVSQQKQNSQDEISQLQSQIKQLSENIGTASGEFDTKLSEQNRQISAIQTTVDATAANTEQIAETVTSLHSKLNINPKTGWLIAEAEYLLSIANQQLLLAGDIDTSINALRSADQRLRESADPTVLNVRSIINDEITQLQSVQVTDITGAALTLASMQSRVDELVLAGKNEEHNEAVIDDTEASTIEQSKEGWRGALDTALNAVKDLVVIRQRGNDASDPLLTPDQRALVYQNLRLKFESARLSLIQGDEATYQQSLDIANEWLLEYFDNDAKRSAVSDTLNELGKVSLTITMPDISTSLDALRAWQLQQNNNAE
ncbi:MAG: hypothetical protein GXP21_08470 [Gammaproteobacteria bacterium]|nr:hypothetical protein [Gammaproteobacteria bacterium]